jgi:hypothetical protein
MCSCVVPDPSHQLHYIKSINDEHLIMAFILCQHGVIDEWSWSGCGIPMRIKEILLKKHGVFYSNNTLMYILDEYGDYAHSFNAKCAAIVLSKLDKWGACADIYARYCLNKSHVSDTSGSLSPNIIIHDSPNDLKRSLVQHIYNYEYWCVLATLSDLPRDIAQYICRLMLTEKLDKSAATKPVKMIVDGNIICGSEIIISDMGGYLTFEGVVL